MIILFSEKNGNTFNGCSYEEEKREQKTITECRKFSCEALHRKHLGTEVTSKASASPHLIPFHLVNSKLFPDVFKHILNIYSQDTEREIKSEPYLPLIRERGQLTC